MLNKMIPNYDGLYGDIAGRQSSEYIFLELIETRSQTFDWVIHPHIHTHLFQVFVVENGAVSFQEATKKYDVQSPCIFLVPPTMLHGLHYTPDARGRILTVSANIIEDTFKTSMNIFKTFEKIQSLNHFEEVPFENITTLLDNIDTELFSEQSERAVMLRAYLTQFFVKLHRMCKQGEVTTDNNLMMGYFRKFQKSVRTSEFTKSIPQFAEELNITPVHLNRICKAISGKSAIEVVNEYFISEAEKYLIHTTYSVSEIAYLLKFEYPNYFAKLFRKYIGFSPNEYRKKNRI